MNIDQLRDDADKAIQNLERLPNHGSLLAPWSQARMYLERIRGELEFQIQQRDEKELGNATTDT